MYLALLICFVASIVLTPFVRKLAFKIGATDRPNHRKVHQTIMPRLGGLAIYISFMIGSFMIYPDIDNKYLAPLLAASSIIVLTGVIDDMYGISPKVKLSGQFIAAFIVVFFGGISVETINIPFGGEIEFGYLSMPLAIIWIIGITNAINLIDGLDGLAAGVSAIVVLSISGVAWMMGDIFVFSICLILLGSILGFLPYNFNPAKIFMGDTGSLFLGFMIAVLSLLGFKSMTVISLIVPVIILGVPISDTLFAIIRRLVNKQPVFSPDKSHLHHCLLNLGYSHRQTVLIIYAISAFFALMAMLFAQVNEVGSIFVIVMLVLAIELLAEKVGLIHKNYRPLLNFVRGVRYMDNKKQ
ncbi:glycosyltransferase family 4 protein [Priestia taiwanensis]|uniref:Undecaprenyl-phosphate alpha-N-acetylglucosaminyl 1-phosphate transferase n=1 Tax=Priestia taiwanensis TaxID=1347902 RepID=A0A917AX51_9BACI|nr:MraY family glycosyltransferase [Priestia taiwanensis]MBM7364363.1 UDP-GlcNAc:undecaprenyl-phosphate GlcNAc-1-phosphate transferase [Priestia taiwanensis]GGE85030.1 undecaprenyl-phosphate alpha-N-acetylglucosaminyl 1-phosphate transferase [Priestia taiwanensis]